MARASAVKIAGIVFYAAAKANFPHHLQIKRGSLLYPLRLQKPVRFFKRFYLLVHIRLDMLHGCLQFGLAGGIVRSGKQHGMVQNPHSMPGDGIHLADAFNLVAEKLNPNGALAVAGRKYLQHIALHAKRAAHKVDVVSLVLNFHQMADDIVPVSPHAGTQGNGKV